MEAKKTEMDQFAGRLEVDIASQIVEHTETAKKKIDDHAGRYKVCNRLPIDKKRYLKIGVDALKS